MQDQSPEHCMWKVARSLLVPICRSRDAGHFLACQPKNCIAHCTRLLQRVTNVDRSTAQGRQYMEEKSIMPWWCKNRQEVATDSSLVLTGINEARSQPTVVRGLCHQRYMLPVKSLNVTKAERRCEGCRISAGRLAAGYRNHTYLTNEIFVSWSNTVRTRPDLAARMARRSDEWLAM